MSFTFNPMTGNLDKVGVTAAPTVTYQLNDDAEFKFGSSNDFRLDYSSSNDGMVLKSEATSSSDSFLSLVNNTSEIFGITYEGVMKFSSVASLPVAAAGRLAFSSNDLYVTKD